MQATPKSILKRPSPQSQSNRDERSLEQIKADRNLETALFHANLIQQRKDIELDILNNIETLLDFPITNSATEIALFKKLIRPFQPSDYDCLIEERNICKKCGYALCPNPNKSDKARGGYRIWGNGRGTNNVFKVGTKAEAERWCGEECARKALYIKIQLSETPAWERIGIQKDVELRGEPELPQSTLAQISEELMKLDLGDSKDTDMRDVDAEERKKAADLALERGEGGAAPIKSVVDVTITEKIVTRNQVAPTFDDVEGMNGELENLHLHLEGHFSQFKQNGLQSQGDEMDMA